MTDEPIDFTTLAEKRADGGDQPRPSSLFDDLKESAETLEPGPRPGLLERFQTNFEAAQRYGTVLGATRDLMHQADRERFDRRYEAFPEWDGAAEGGAALAGQLAGSMTAIENLIPIGLAAKVAGRFGNGLAARILGGAVEAGVVNAVTDPAIQGIEIAGGSREAFDPGQAAASIAIGTAAGAAVRGAGEAIGAAVRPRNGETADLAPATGEKAPPASETAAAGDEAKGPDTGSAPTDDTAAPPIADRPVPPPEVTADPGPRSEPDGPSDVAPAAEAAARPEGDPTPPVDVQPETAIGDRLDAEARTAGVLPPRPAPALIGKDVPRMPAHRVATVDGTSIEVRPVVVEARDLVTSADEGFDAALQPRQRDRAASQAQILEIAGRLEPERLGQSSEADRGAPIVGPDRLVESGNGRVAAIREAYARGGEVAARYRAFLTDLGIDVTGYSEPVLVRQRMTDLDPAARQDFTIAANRSAILAMSASERALADARNLSTDLLAMIRNPADLSAAANVDFVRAFVSTLPSSEVGSLTRPDGTVSAEGLARVRNAVLAAAYGDPDVIARVTETTDDEIRSISSALTIAAPGWAAFRRDVAEGRVPAALDVTDQLMEAVKRTADLRARGQKLDEYLDQIDAFNRIEPTVEQWIRLFYDPKGKRAAGVDSIAASLGLYSIEARKVRTDAGLGLGLDDVTAARLLDLADRRRTRNVEPGQGSLFAHSVGDGPDGGGGGQGTRRPGSGEGRAQAGGAGGGRAAEGGDEGLGAGGRSAVDPEKLLPDTVRRVGEGPLGPIVEAPPEAWSDAAAWLLANRTGEIRGAVSNPAVGPIDVIFGDERTGLLKISQKHPEVLDDLPSRIESMEVIFRSANRVRLRSETDMAVVRLDYDGQAKTWLLTAYEIDVSRRDGSSTERPAGRQKDTSSSSPAGFIVQDGSRGSQILSKVADLFGRRGRGRPALAPDRAAAGTPAGAATNDLGFARIAELSTKISAAIDVPSVRQGRLALRSRAGQVLGTYAPGSGALRIRHRDDFDVFTHEAGHHLDVRLGAPLQALLQRHPEVDAFAYPGTPKGLETVEGFAEFFRLWMTNRAAIDAVGAVKLRTEFETLLAGAMPEVARDLDDVAAAWSAWLKAPSGQAVAATIVTSKRPGWIDERVKTLKRHGFGRMIADEFETAYARFVDDLSGLNRAVRGLARIHLERTGKRLDIDVAGDAYKLARLSRNGYGEGHMDIMYGVTPYRGTKVASPSLRDAIVTAMRKPNAAAGWDDATARSFGAYLWSRRALGEWDRFESGLIPNPPDKLTKGDHQVNVRELATANPQFAQAAELVYAWNRALWDKKRDAGLISPDEHAAGLEIRDYVPGLRDWSYEGDPDGAAGGSRTGRAGGDPKSGFVRAFRGSTRDVIDPLESLVADAYRTSMAIKRNDVLRALDRLAKIAGNGAAAIAERIPSHELKAHWVAPIEALEAAAREAGLSQADVVSIRDEIEGLIGDQKGAIFRPAVINEKGEPIVFWRDGGKLQAMRLADGAFGREMYRALTMMSRQENTIFMEFAAGLANVQRASITTEPMFLLSNFIRDQVTSFVYYGQPFKRLAGTGRGMAEEIMGAEAARRYNALGGAMGGAQTANLAEARVARDISVLKRRGWMATRLKNTSSLTGFLSGLGQVTELSETGVRLALWREFTDAAKARGLPEHEAMMEGAWRARDHIDFDRRGSQLAALARMVPFLNASIQGLDKTARVMLVPVARKWAGRMVTVEDERLYGESVKAWARLGVLAIGTLGLHALMSRYPDYDEVSRSTRATHWMVKWGENWLAVPKPYDIAPIVNIVEAAWDAFAKSDPIAGETYLSDLYQVLAPPSLLQAPVVKIPVEWVTGKDLFTGGDIVPEALKGLEPWLQYTGATSMLSRAFGDALGTSPVVTDHFIGSLFASWGANVLALTDWASGAKPRGGWDEAPFTRRFVKAAWRGSRSERQFWSLMAQENGRFTTAAQSYRAMSADPVAAADYLASLDDARRAYVTAEMSPAAVQRLHPMIRAAEAVRAIGQITRQLGVMDLRDRDGNRIPLSPADAGAARAILEDLQMVEARNALIAVGEPGWAQRAPMPTDSYLSELRAISPALATLLADRYATRKVLPRAVVERAWPEVRRRLVADGTAADLSGVAAEAEAGGWELGGERIKPAGKPAVQGVGGG